MCRVFRSVLGVVVLVYNEKDMNPSARINRSFDSFEDWLSATKKPVAKKCAPAPVLVKEASLTSRQFGGELVKRLELCWGNEDSMGHYRQRCGEHNHREQACRKTARRRQVVRY